MASINWPPLSSLEIRSKVLPIQPFRYTGGVFTGCKVCYTPNPKKFAETYINMLKDNPGDRQHWPIYLELYELIIKYEESLN
jgi:hypothetical protein